MPTLNGYTAHIALQSDQAKHLQETKRVLGRDGVTVSCFIPAHTGELFFAKWNVSRGARKGIPYSAEFIIDGMSVTPLLFDEKDAQDFYGGQIGDCEDEAGEMWHFMFREFTCSGEPPSVHFHVQNPTLRMVFPLQGGAKKQYKCQAMSAL